MEFEEIYRTYFNDVFRYIRNLSGNEDIAEEITADTFFKAMRSIDKFRGECEIRVWLCQIAKNTYLSYIKKAARVKSIEESELQETAAPSDAAEESFIMHNTAQEIQKLLHGIPDPYKEVFMWRVFVELNFKDIGRIFGKSENWACVTYHRAKEKIKERSEATKNEK